MKKITLLPLAALLFLWACGSNNTNNGEAQADNPTEMNNVSSANNANSNTKVEWYEAPFDENDAKDLTYKGEIVDGETWTDANGKNVMLFTETHVYRENPEGLDETDVTLHAYHYANSNNGYKLLREVNDFEKDCNADPRARFVENSVTVTDIDGNGYGEITFAYRLGCTSELSPDGLKLLMLENGEKYIIRGNTAVNYGGGNTIGGDTKIDASFDKAPNGFLDYAKKVWAKQKEHNSCLGPRPYLVKQLSKYKDARLGGTEPNWSVKINDDYVAVIPNIGEPAIRYNYDNIRKLPKGFQISAQNPDSNESILLEITDEKCSDGMSDTKYPIKIYMSWRDNQYNGCGRR